MGSKPRKGCNFLNAVAVKIAPYEHNSVISGKTSEKIVHSLGNILCNNLIFCRVILKKHIFQLFKAVS